MSTLQEKLLLMAPSIFRGTPVLFAYLYGSYAGGAPNKFSDLDVGIFIKGLDAAICLELELTLALHIDEKLGHAVQSEVRVVNHLPLVVKGRILAEGDLIYSIAEEQRVEFESRVRLAYFDFLPMLQAYNKSFRQQVIDGLR